MASLLTTGFNTVIGEDVSVGDDTKIWHHCNIYRARIGKNCNIASYVEIGGATIGDNCKIEAYTFIPPGVTIGNEVFIGPHVTFTNDKYPRATEAFTLCRTLVRDGASIGAGSIILSGVTIGEKAMVGAGSLIVKDVPAGMLVYGDGAVIRGTVH